jgi:tRNA(Ile)-lysidine synthase
VATGHTEDDQVETIVLNTLRGSGAYGQAGMLPDRPWPHAGDPRVRALRLVRPLLSLPREATRAYCRERCLAYVDDAMNDDPAFARNRVRAMLADVEAETPDARALILRTAALARATLTTLEAAAAKAVPMRDAEDGRAIALDRGPLRAMPPELSGYAWHRAVERLLGDTRDFARRHYATLHAAADARTGAVFELPRGVVLTVDADALLISIGRLDDPPVPPDAAHGAPFAGVLGAWYVEFTPAETHSPQAGLAERAGLADIRERAIEVPDRDGTIHVASADKNEAGLSVNGPDVAGARSAWEGELVLDLPADAILRARRPGDRIALPGGRHTKLHDAYIDAKIPHRHRDGAPVLASGCEILWSPLLAHHPVASTDARGVPATALRLRWRRAPRQ